MLLIDPGACAAASPPHEGPTMRNSGAAAAMGMTCSSRLHRVLHMPSLVTTTSDTAAPRVGLATAAWLPPATLSTTTSLDAASIKGKACCFAHCPNLHISALGLLSSAHEERGCPAQREGLLLRCPCQLAPATGPTSTSCMLLHYRD